MELILDYRWEHALIAAIVEASSRKCPTCYLGRTAIQKLLYFLNVLGVPMRYSFDIHHYGPFCADIMHDTDWLLADDVLEDLSQDKRYSNYRTAQGWPDVMKQYQGTLDEYKRQIEDVSTALSDLSPGTLELIATLDFSYRWVRAQSGKGPWKDSAIQKFKSIKKEKFSDRDIERWYSVLVDAGLIEK